MIAVSLVDGDPFARASSMAALRKGPLLRLLDAYASGQEALAYLPDRRPHVILVEVHLPDMSGAACVARLKALAPRTQALMLSTCDEDEAILESLRAGASGYLLKSMPGPELVRAVQQVHAGGSPISPRISRQLVDHVRRTSQTAWELEGLSGREKEILALLAKGCFYLEIAQRLDISLSTVRAHLHSVYRKLGVRSRTQAALAFLQWNSQRSTQQLAPLTLHRHFARVRRADNTLVRRPYACPAR